MEPINELSDEEACDIMIRPENINEFIEFMRKVDVLLDDKETDKEDINNDIR